MQFLVLFLAFTALAVQAAPKEILILHSYRAGYDWTDEVTRGLRTKLGEAGQFNLWFEFLDARRREYPKNVPEVLSRLAHDHQGRKFDLIIASDDEALDFVANRSEGVLGTPPVVFCGISSPALAAEVSRERFTGLIETFNTQQILGLALRLRPGAKNIYFVSDSTPFGVAMSGVFEAAGQKLGPAIAYHRLDGRQLSIAQLRETVAAIPPDSVVMTLQLRQDSAGRYVDATSGEMSMAAVSPVPVFGVALSQVGGGMLMGTPNRGFQHAARAAEVALRVLRGTPPKAIPVVEEGAVDFLFDYGEMERWHISEDQLPNGAQVLNRPPSMWRDYGRWIVGGLVFAALQFFAIGVLIVNVMRRRSAQADLRKALRRAQEADALKSRFLANMSHELRTPMNGVLGLLQSLQTTRLDPEQKEEASLAADAARSLLTVLNDILDLSQIDAGNLKIINGEFSLRRELPRICSLLMHRAAVTGVSLRCRVDESVPARLVGDGDRLRQILINLAANALKFTEDGEVRIEAREVGRTGDISTIRVEVIDTGIGIPAEQMERIFEPFTQVDSSSSRRFGGIGLGLAISRELVRLMKGRIGGESKIGQGSVFWLEIPFAYGTEELPSAGVAEVPRLEGRTVLLVEDNAVNRLVARKMLDRTGCRTIQAEDAEQCLRRLDEEPVDLILMDVQMPGMSGLEATRVIRGREDALGRVPIVALTASSMVGDREECLAAGMDDYLSKPIDAKDLHQALGKWLQRNLRMGVGE